MTATKIKELTNTERANLIERLIKENILITTGGTVFVQTSQGFSPVITFVKEDDGSIFAATPENVPLFEASSLFNFCKEKAKEIFLPKLDQMLKEKEAVSKIKTKKILTN